MKSNIVLLNSRGYWDYSVSCDSKNTLFLSVFAYFKMETIQEGERLVKGERVKR